MGTVNMVKTIKKIYPETVTLVKIGNFYHVYSKDAYIFAYLFEYKIIEKENVASCGFPINSLSKVESILEKNKINYIVLDRKNNYEEDEKYINQQENNYEKIFKKSHNLVEQILRIQAINKKIMSLKEDEDASEILDKIETVLNNERREI